MKVLLTGYNGQLGYDCYNLLKSDYTITVRMIKVHYELLNNWNLLYLFIRNFNSCYTYFCCYWLSIIFLYKKIHI